jgi:hypothetical protein
MTVALRGNTVRWTDAFLNERETARRKGPLAGIVVGSLPLLDPGELLFETVDDHLDAPARAPRGTAILVHGATINGRPYTRTSFTLPPPATAAAGTGPTGQRSTTPRR